MSAAVSTSPVRVAFRPNWWARTGWILLIVYVFYAVSLFDVSWARFVIGLDNGARFVARMFPPNFSRWEVLSKGLAESLQIAVLASALGLLLSLPVGLAAARNLMPVWATWPARLLIALCRSFNPVIVAIIFVKALGFGAVSGIAALTVASIGFTGKLFAEAIEEISLKQVEAVRASGAPFMNVIAFGVLPQVFGRFIGFATYQLDSNLRNSTMVGIVGAGGIGGALFAAFQRFDYDFVCAILLAIIALIFAGEILAARVRAVFLAREAVNES